MDFPNKGGLVNDGTDIKKEAWDFLPLIPLFRALELAPIVGTSKLQKPTPYE